MYETKSKSKTKVSVLWSLYKRKEIDAIGEYFYKEVLYRLNEYHLYKYAYKLLSLLDMRYGRNLLPLKKRISVITVNYNNIEGLKKTVQSVTKQTSRNDIQFIIMDGGSSDGSLEYIRTMEDHIDICAFGKDCGVYDAMNRGIELADSEFSIFMNSGDCFDSVNVIEKFLRFLEMGVSGDVVIGDCRLSDGAIWKAGEPEDLWKGMICSHQSMFFKTEVIKKYKYSTVNQVVSDYEVITKIYYDGFYFKKIPLLISEIEAVGLSSDFQTRTIERWNVVRKLVRGESNRSYVDHFYNTLLSTDGKWISPKNHVPDSSRLNLVNDIQRRVIFLISMPRSGSTMLQKVIEQSPDVGTTGEPWVMLPLLSMYDDNLQEAKYSQEYNIVAKDALEDEIGLPNLIHQAQKVYADSIYSNLLSVKGTRYFLDKTPRYVHIVQRLKKLYPQAKFVVLLRNPAAVITSYATTWGKNSYHRLSKNQYFWHDFSYGFKELRDFVKSDFLNKHIIHYEDFVLDPEKEAVRLFKYLGLNYSSSFIEYNADGDSKKFRLGDPRAVYQNSKPQKESAERWVTFADSAEKKEQLIDLLSAIGDNIVCELGYSYSEIIQKLDFGGRGSFLLDKLINKYPEILDPPAIENAQYSGNDRSDCSLGVLITCYNNRDTIAAAIYSVINQSKIPDLIVVADDHSTDDSLAIIQEVVSKNSQVNIKVVSRRKNIGISRNRDYAIRDMPVDYITTLDGDDLFSPHKIESEFLALKGRTDTVSFSDTIVVEPQSSKRLDSSPYGVIEKNESVVALLSRSYPVPRDMMFPKSLYLECGGFDDNLNLYEDWAFKVRLMEKSCDMGWVHSGSIGTIYDRRRPGLSNTSRYLLVVGQLLSFVSNDDVIDLADPGVSSSFLSPVISSLVGPLKERFSNLQKEIESPIIANFFLNRLYQLWNIRKRINDRHIAERVLWEITRPFPQEGCADSPFTIANKKCALADFEQYYICTPVYNSIETIDRTINSVISQSVEAHVVYHIQDGVSTDGTIERLEHWKYRIDNNLVKIGPTKLTFSFESSPDKGMYDAIEKCFNKFSINDSDWMTWINSDDYLEKGALECIRMVSGSAKDIEWITGFTSVLTQNGDFIRYFNPINKDIIAAGACDGRLWSFVQQEGTFWRGRLWKKLATNFFSRLKYGNDWLLWLEFAKFADIYVFKGVLGNFCIRKGQITDIFLKEYMSEIESIVCFDDRKNALAALLDGKCQSNIVNWNFGELSFERLSVRKSIVDRLASL